MSHQENETRRIMMERRYAEIARQNAERERHLQERIARQQAQKR